MPKYKINVGNDSYIINSKNELTNDELIGYSNKIKPQSNQIEQNQTKQQNEKYNKQTFGELNPVKAAIQGIGQGATMGFSDEIAGSIDNILGNKSMNVDERRKYMSALQDKYPILYTGSEIAGSFLNPVGKALKVGKAIANPILNTAKNLAPSAIEGAITSLGISENKNIGDAAKGAVMGAGTTALFGGAGKLAKSLGAEKLLKKAEQAAGQSVIPFKSALGKIFKESDSPAIQEQKMNAFNKIALESGIGKSFKNTTDRLNNTSKIKNKIGQEIGNIYNKIDEKGANINIDELKDKILSSDYVKKISKHQVIKQPQLKNISDNIEQLEQIKLSSPDIKLTELFDLKKAIGEDAYLNEAKMRQPAKQVERIINDYLQEVAEKTNPKSANKIKQLNNKYSNLDKMESILKKKAIKETGNKKIGLTDWLALASGGGIGLLGAGLGLSPQESAALGGSVFAGKKLAERYGYPMSAKTLEALSKLSSKVGKTPIPKIIEKSTGDTAQKMALNTLLYGTQE